VCLYGDGFVSWFELKSKTVKGAPKYDLDAWGQRVPIIRCYWHVEGSELDDQSKVISATGLANVYIGTPRWYGDKDAH